MPQRHSRPWPENSGYEVPDVIVAWLLAAQTTGVFGPELLAPATDRFIRYHDAALQQHFLDMPQAQRKPIVQPHRVGDDLRREAMAFVADGRGAHANRPIPQKPDRKLT